MNSNYYHINILCHNKSIEILHIIIPKFLPHFFLSSFFSSSSSFSSFSLIKGKNGKISIALRFNSLPKHESTVFDDLPAYPTNPSLLCLYERDESKVFLCHLSNTLTSLQNYTHRGLGFSATLYIPSKCLNISSIVDKSTLSSCSLIERPRDVDIIGHNGKYFSISSMVNMMYS